MEATEVLAPRTESIALRLRLALERLLELDFTQPAAFAALALAFVASRVYWLDLGYGTDPDAWRVALSAEYLWDQGEYLPSRLPGYPLHELVTAALIKGGWFFTNLSTLLVSLAGVYVFAMLAKRLEVPHAGALTLTFAFAPLLWINSVTTMDYMWALTFLMASYLALLYGYPTGAGILLGVAGGFRLTAMFMLPVFWLFLWRSGRRPEVRPLTMTALATVLVAFTPVLMEYGLSLLNFYDEKVPVDEFFKRLGKDGLGIIGALAVLGGIAVSWRRLRGLPGDLLRDPHVLTWTAALLLFAFSYTRLPHEIAYLLPLFPFGLFLMARYFSRGVLAFVLGAIVLAGFVDITSPGDPAGLDRTTFTSARVGQGMLLSSVDTLRNQMDFAREVRELTATNDQVRTPAVIVVGFIYPELVMLYEDELDVGILEEDLGAISQISDKGMAIDPVRDIHYVWLLEFDEMERYRRDGFTIYVTADAQRSTYAVYGYRPGFFDAIELPLSRENPSLGAGTAATDR